MKKALIALGVLLVIIGVVMVAIFGGEEGFWSLWDAASGSHDFSTATEGKAYSPYETNQLKSVQVTCKYYSVYVRTTQDDFVSVKYPELDGGTFISVSPQIDESGVLSVNQTGENAFWGNINGSKKFLVIYIPQKLSQLDIKIDSKVGKIDLQADCGALYLSTDTGLITAKTNVAGNAMAVSKTGAIDFNASAKEVILDAKTGAINFAVTSNKIEVSAQTGAINGVVKGTKADYDISVTKHTGSSNLKNQTAGKGKSLTVKVSTGAINVEFI